MQNEKRLGFAVIIDFLRQQGAIDPLTRLLPKLAWTGIGLWVLLSLSEVFPIPSLFWLVFVACFLLFKILEGLIRKSGSHLGRLFSGFSADLLISLLITGIAGLAFKTLSSGPLWGVAGFLFLTTRLASFLVGRVFNGEQKFGEALRLALLPGVAIYSLHPYVVAYRVGAGDAYHYALMVADFIEQLRHNIFPVFIGQSPFAFNGNIHTLRTAPYFVHLAGFLYELTGASLSATALVHGTLVFSAVGGALSMYICLYKTCGRAGWKTFIFTAIYCLSPAALAPIYEGDMVATYLTLPFLPWWAYGLGRVAESPTRLGSWLYSSTVLAILWLVHPPIAFWATAISTLNGFSVFLLNSQKAIMVKYILAASAAFALLSGYVFVSVFELKLPTSISTDGASNILAGLATSWKKSLLPLSGNFLSDLQLGYALLVGGLVGAIFGLRRPGVRAWLISATILVLMEFPFPGLTSFLWSMVPQAVIEITNNWPMQRFYPLLAALATMLACTGFSPASSERKGHLTRSTIGLTLGVLGLAWSWWEVQVFFRHAKVNRESIETTRLSYRPENVILTRSSYLLFGFFPPYFSSSHMDPLAETRFFDPVTLAYFGNGWSREETVNTEQATLHELRFTDSPSIKIKVAPQSSYLLNFEFTDPNIHGFLQLSSSTLRQEYALPSSGLAKSFGAGPDSNHELLIENTLDQTDEVRLRLITGQPTTAGPGVLASRPAVARVTARVVKEKAGLARLTALIPLKLEVNADRPMLLETPRVFVPGYRAIVNSQPRLAFPTKEGLVGVLLEKGDRDVTIDYIGSRLLRISYWITFFSYVIFFGAILARPFWAVRGISTKPLETYLHRFFAHGAVKMTIISAGAITLGVGIYQYYSPRFHVPLGAEMNLLLPFGRDSGAEPILVSGATGKADVVYIKYLGAGQIKLGHDRWGVGADESAPVKVELGRTQNLKISFLPLPSGPREEIAVAFDWNGVRVFTSAIPGVKRAEAVVVIGRNRIGASTCEPYFSGRVVDAHFN